MLVLPPGQKGQESLLSSPPEWQEENTDRKNRTFHLEMLVKLSWFCSPRQARQVKYWKVPSYMFAWRKISSTAYYFLHIKTTVLNLQVLTPPNFEQFFKMVQGKAQHNPQSMMLLLRRKFIWHPSIKIKNMQMSWMQNSINYLHKKHCVYLDNLILKLNHLPRKLTTQKQTICICRIAGTDETN